MSSLPKQDRERALEALAVWCLLQLKGLEPDQDHLDKLGFGSVEAMRIQLGNWGLPDWVTDNERVAERPKAPKSPPPERKARQGGGEVEELPAAASDLFSGAIDRLKTDLYYTKHLNEVLQDGRFVTTFVFPKEAGYIPEIYHREEVSPERWEELCAEHDKDPASTKVLTAPVENWTVGPVEWHPSSHLVHLIAVYLMFASSWSEVEELLNKLHPKSREPNREKLYKYLTGDRGLHRPIKNIASEVRGKTIGQGRTVEGVDLFTHRVGDFMQRAGKQGIPVEERRRMLREEFKFTEDKISRLEKLFTD